MKIINLGLDPEEALGMELQVEKVERQANSKRQPVADYIPDGMKKWLQGHRVELNAMSPGQLLEWLDRKMAEHDGEKVVPPEAVLVESLDGQIHARLEEQITQLVLREANVPERVEQEYGKREPAILARLETLKEDVRRGWQWSSNPGPPGQAIRAHLGHFNIADN